MASLSDSRTTGIPVTLNFTDQALTCVPPAVVEALRAADLRIDLPDSDTSQDIAISTLTDNLIRTDTAGALYAPATQVVELAQQQITIATTTAPGVPTTLSFSAAAVQDLETAFLNVFFDYIPPGALVRHNAPRISGGNLLYDFYRLNGSAGPPYEEVIVSGYGRVAVIPSPSTA